MNCPACKAIVSDDALYCEKCSHPLKEIVTESNQDLKRSLMFMAILIYWDCFLVLFWLLINKVIIRLLLRGDRVSEIELVSGISGWMFSLLSIALGIVFVVLCKPRVAKGAMIAFLVCQAMSLFFYHMLGGLNNVFLHF
jgi:hypothetical protein